MRPDSAISLALGATACAALLCAPAPAADGDVVISEIFYHPPSECEEEEFIELYNRSDLPVDLSGWSFADGIVFTFPPGSTLAPGGYLAVGRDPDGFRDAFGPGPDLYGPYGDRLGNTGEMIVLADAAGEEIDRVRYNDKLPWPVSPDGGGPSLELLDPSAPNDKARNWRAAGETGERWALHRAAGEAGDDLLRIRLTGPGEYLVDDIALVPEEGGEDLVANGGFEDDLAGWLAAGDHGASEVLDGEGRDGGRALRVRAVGGIEGGVEQTIPGVVPGARYVLTLWARRVTPGIGLVAGIAAGASTALQEGRDIGSVGSAGRQSYDAGTDRWTVEGSGADIWGSSDAFHYAYTVLDGDGSIEAEVAWSGRPPNGWSKAGVMIRESTSPSSPHAMVILSRDHGVRLQWRPSAGGSSQDRAGPSTGGPVRLRLEREGDDLVAFADTGGGWSAFGSATIPMADVVLIGLAVTAHQNGAIARATFREVVIGGGGLYVRTPAGEEGPVTLATPGAPNTQATDDLPPYLRKPAHYPHEPTSGDAVLVEVKADDEDGLEGVAVRYQVVEPGRYVRKVDPAYAEGWVEVAMRDDGLWPDEKAGDDLWTAELPPRPHRTLVRYRFEARDTRGNVTRLPYGDDPSPNLAYFVHDGVPDYVADVRSAQGPVPFAHPAEGLAVLPVYHLIARGEDIRECEDVTIPFSSKVERHAFKWWGTFVFRGDVYDHIRFRLRGGVWRYTYPKRYYKIRFNRGHFFRGVDDLGRPRAEETKTLNLNAVIGNPSVDDRIRGECGLYETLAFALFRWAGVPSAQTTWVHFRIVDDEREAPDQYGGDFYGIYLDIEQPDQAFLRSNDRSADGNLYKIDTGAVSGGRWDKEVNGCDPADDADIRRFVGTYESSSPSPSWWRESLDLDGYYSYRAIIDACEHYDIGAGKNYYYYHNPESGLWEVFPWDVDLTFVAGWGNGNEPFKSRVIDRFPSGFGREYRNRVREIEDLLYREDKVFPIIDAWVDRIAPMTRADRDRWDRGLFRSIEQRAGELKAWIRNRTRFMENLARDAGIPETPAIRAPPDRASVPAGGFRIEATAFADPDAGARHAASRWIATRVPRFTDPSEQETIELVPLGARWRFLRGRTAPGGTALAWTRTGYDDGGWEEGPAGIGYGDGDDATVLADMRGAYTTVYLRHVFDVDDPSAIGALELSVDYDDGFAAYLNGTRVAGANAPAADPVPHDALATGSHEAGGPQVIDLSERIDLLRPGANVLALQGLNVSLSSSDLTLHPTLRAYLGDPASFRESLEDLLSWNELDPDWTSGETADALEAVDVPAGVLEPGGIYRLRVRYRDETGRWSHWSPFVEVAVAPSENHPPEAAILAFPESGRAPLHVVLDAAGSKDPDRDPLTYAWDFGDGGSGEGQQVIHVYAAPGAYEVRLEVRDGRGGTGTATTMIRVDPAAGIFLRGDANGDGARDIADAIAILSYLFADGPLDCPDAGDGNDDGRIDLGDAIRVLDFLFVSPEPLPAPFDAPGPDPTPDDLGCERP